MNWEKQMDKLTLRNQITGMAPVPFRLSVAFGPSNVLKKQRTQQAEELFVRSDAVVGIAVHAIYASRQTGRQAATGQARGHAS